MTCSEHYITLTLIQPWGAPHPSFVHWFMCDIRPLWIDFVREAFNKPVTVDSCLALANEVHRGGAGSGDVSGFICVDTPRKPFLPYVTTLCWFEREEEKRRLNQCVWFRGIRGIQQFKFYSSIHLKLWSMCFCTWGTGRLNLLHPCSLFNVGLVALLHFLK